MRKPQKPKVDKKEKPLPKPKKATAKKEKVLSKPKKVTNKETAKEEIDSGVEFNYRLHLFDIEGRLVSNKFLGKMTQDNAVVLMERFIFKKQSAVKGKLIVE